MWRVEIQEGKDHPKKADRARAFPSEFRGYSKTATLMLENLTLHTGKAASMDSWFSVSVEIIAMHNHEVHGQALVKKRPY